MRLSVVICSFNRAESLRRVLEEIDRQAVPADLTWEVLVVDNASTDGTGEVAKAFAARRPDRFRALREPQKGKSRALNLAISEARGEILAFTDDDVEIPDNWVAELAKAFATFECAGVGGRIKPSFHQGRPPWMAELTVRWIRGPLVHFEFGDAPRRVDAAPFGANMAFRADVFKRHGNFRVDLGPAGGATLGGEDVEMGGRVLAAGETIMYIPTAVLCHPVEPHRLSKKYFEEWWYRHGRTSMHLNDEPPGPALTGGVPRHLIRRAGGSALRWIFGVDAKKRMYAKLAMLEALGSIAETRARRRARR